MDKGYFGELMELLPHAAIVQRKDLPPTASYEGVDKGQLQDIHSNAHEGKWQLLNGMKGIVCLLCIATSQENSGQPSNIVTNEVAWVLEGMVDLLKACDRIELDTTCELDRRKRKGVEHD